MDQPPQTTDDTLSNSLSAAIRAHELQKIDIIWRQLELLAESKPSQSKNLLQQTLLSAFETATKQGAFIIPCATKLAKKIKQIPEKALVDTLNKMLLICTKVIENPPQCDVNTGHDLILLLLQHNPAEVWDYICTHLVIMQKLLSYTAYDRSRSFIELYFAAPKDKKEFFSETLASLTQAEANPLTHNLSNTKAKLRDLGVYLDIIKESPPALRIKAFFPSGDSADALSCLIKGNHISLFDRVCQDIQDATAGSATLQPALIAAFQQASRPNESREDFIPKIIKTITTFPEDLFMATLEKVREISSAPAWLNTINTTLAAFTKRLSESINGKASDQTENIGQDLLKLDKFKRHLKNMRFAQKINNLYLHLTKLTCNINHPNKNKIFPYIQGCLHEAEPVYLWRMKLIIEVSQFEGSTTELTLLLGELKTDCEASHLTRQQLKFIVESTAFDLLENTSLDIGCKQLIQATLASSVAETLGETQSSIMEKWEKQEDYAKHNEALQQTLATADKLSPQLYLRLSLAIKYRLFPTEIIIEQIVLNHSFSDDAKTAIIIELLFHAYHNSIALKTDVLQANPQLRMVEDSALAVATHHYCAAMSSTHAPTNDSGACTSRSPVHDKHVLWIYKKLVPMSAKRLSLEAAAQMLFSAKSKSLRADILRLYLAALACTDTHSFMQIQNQCIKPATQLSPQSTLELFKNKPVRQSRQPRT